MILENIKIMLVKGAKGDKGEDGYDDTELRQLIADEAEEREAEIAQLERDWLNYMYPVGAIYMSVNSTSPATLFGGTWARIEGRFLLASGGGYNAGTTGGEASHTLTTNELPSHNHKYAWFEGIDNTDDPVAVSGDQWCAYRSNYTSIADLRKFGIRSSSTPETSDTGGGQAHNNMPPYLAVYVWKRTA